MRDEMRRLSTEFAEAVALLQYGALEEAVEDGSGVGRKPTQQKRNQHMPNAAIKRLDPIEDNSTPTANAEQGAKLIAGLAGDTKLALVGPLFRNSEKMWGRCVAFSDPTPCTSRPRSLWVSASTSR